LALWPPSAIGRVWRLRSASDGVAAPEPAGDAAAGQARRRDWQATVELVERRLSTVRPISSPPERLL
jgi:hypothetical protein